MSKRLKFWLFLCVGVWLLLSAAFQTLPWYLVCASVLLGALNVTYAYLNRDAA